MNFCCSLSTNSDLTEACNEVSQEVRKGLDGAADLCFVFASSGFGHQVDQVPTLLHEMLQPGTLAGCCGGGIIGGGFEVEGATPALSVVAASLPGVQLFTSHIAEGDLPDGDAPPQRWTGLCGIGAADAAGFIVLPEPFSFNADKLLAGLDFAYPDAPKVGGIASGASQPGGNTLFLDRSSHHNGAVVVGLSGDVAMDTMVAQGCKPFGKVGRITEADQNLLMSIDNKPATAFLQDQLEDLEGADLELAKQTPLFLGIAMDPFATDEPDHGDFLIRNLMGFDPNSGSLAVAALLSVGRPVQFHLRDGGTSAHDLRRVLESQAGGGDYRGALLFSCLGRGEHLYGEPHHDSRMFRETLGTIPLGGFFCNGEIGPVQGSTYLHGYTSSFGVFRQRT